MALRCIRGPAIFWQLSDQQRTSQDFSPSWLSSDWTRTGRAHLYTRSLRRLVVRVSGSTPQSGCATRVSRHRELKDGPAAQIRARPETSAMLFHNQVADRQPKPQAARFGRIEGLEETLRRWRQSRSRISHSHQHAARIGLLGVYHQLLAPPRWLCTLLRQR
jgi:hypothetical protein